MDSYKNWTYEDYTILSVSVLVTMGIAFLAAFIYQKHELNRLSKLEIPLNP